MSFNVKLLALVLLFNFTAKAQTTDIQSYENQMQAQQDQKRADQIDAENKLPGATAKAMYKQAQAYQAQMANYYGGCPDCTFNPTPYQDICNKIAKDNFYSGFGMAGGMSFTPVTKVTVPAADYTNAYKASMDGMKKYYSDNCGKVKDGASWSSFLMMAHESGCMSPCKAAKKSDSTTNNPEMVTALNNQCVSLCNSYFYTARAQANGFAEGLTSCKSSGMGMGAPMGGGKFDPSKPVGR